MTGLTASNYCGMRLRMWRILQINEVVIHRDSWRSFAISLFVFPLRNITQPCPQVFSVNGSIICGGLHFWRHFDVIGWIIFGGLHIWRHWFNMAKILSKFGEQQLVMVNYACGFNQSETGNYFEWIIMYNIVSYYTILYQISYLNCRGKLINMIDHRSYTHNFKSNVFIFCSR